MGLHDWATAFESRLKTLIGTRDFRQVVAHEEPLRYVLPHWRNDEPVTSPVEGFGLTILRAGDVLELTGRAR